MFFTLPYFGLQSEKLKPELRSSLSKLYPFVDFNIILTNSFKIGSFFRYKDKLPKGMLSSVIYKFCCAQCKRALYIGSTKRSLKARTDQHAGRSFQTGFHLSKPDQSHIRDHKDRCGISVNLANFEILSFANNYIELRILESLHINTDEPNLNEYGVLFHFP